MHSRAEFQGLDISLSWDGGPFEDCAWQAGSGQLKCGERFFDVVRDQPGYIDGKPIGNEAYPIGIPAFAIGKDGTRWGFEPRQIGRVTGSVSSKNFECYRSKNDPALFIQAERRHYRGEISRVGIGIGLRAVVWTSHRVIRPSF